MIADLRVGGWGYRCVGKAVFAVAVGVGRVIADLRAGGGGGVIAYLRIGSEILLTSQFAPIYRRSESCINFGMLSFDLGPEF